MQIEHIHPMIVHFPIVLALIALAFDAWSLTSARFPAGGIGALHTGTILLTLGALSALLAFVFGDIAYDIAVTAGQSEALLEDHEGWGTTTAAVFMAAALLRLFLWWRGLDERSAGRAAAVASSAAVAVLVLVTAYFGGHLVYDLGVNVAAIK